MKVAKVNWPPLFGEQLTSVLHGIEYKVYSNIINSSMLIGLLEYICVVCS